MRTITTHMETKPRGIRQRIHGKRWRWKGKFQTYTFQAPKVATITRAIRTQIIITPSKSWTWINMAGACKGIPKKRLISQMRDIREVHSHGRRHNLVEDSKWMRRLHMSNTKPLRSMQQDTKWASLPHLRFLRGYLLSRLTDIQGKLASTKMTSCRWNLSFRPLYSCNRCKRLIRRSTRQRCARTGSKSASADTATNASLLMEKTSWWGRHFLSTTISTSRRPARPSTRSYTALMGNGASSSMRIGNLKTSRFSFTSIGW